MRGWLSVIGAVLWLAVAPAAALAQDPNLMGEWHLDSLGASTPDSSGHGNNATVVGSPQAVSDGRFSQAVRFPAKSDVLDAGNVATLQPGNVSVVAWIRKSGAPSTVQTIVSQGAHGSCAFASYALYTGGSSDAVGLRFYIWNGSSTFRTGPAPSSIWDGQWHAVVGTYDGSTLRLYVDGTEVSNASGSGQIGYGPDPGNFFTNNDFTIGNYAGASTCSEPATQFPGDIDEVRLYNRALSASEVSFLSSASATSPPELQTTPPPGPDPENVSPPTVSRLGTAGGPTNTYYCNPGTWRNLPSPPNYSYRWVATENDRPVPVGSGQQFTPSPDVYGYPITCEVSVQGHAGTVTATSASSFYTSAGPNALPPAYGDIRVRGIDVFQVIQPNAGAQEYGYNSDGSTFPFTEPCSGGTPTPFHQGDANNDFLCTLGNVPDPQAAMQRANYRGVTLDSDKSTVAVVYVNMFNHAPGDPKLPIKLELSGTLNGASLGDPLVVSLAPVDNSVGPLISADDRAKGGYEFHLPSAWTAPGTLQLTAHLDFPKSDFGASYGAHQCDDPTKPPGGDPTFGFYPLPNCTTDDTFTLDGIPTKTFEAPIFQPVQLLTNGQSGFSRTPDQIMGAAKQLYPGGEHIQFEAYSPYTINIDNVSKTTVDSSNNCSNGLGMDSEFQKPRICRWLGIDNLMQQWVIDNPARLLFCGLYCVKIRMYDAVLGVSDYDSGAGGNMVGCPTAGAYCPEPGFQHPYGNDITKVSATGPSPSETGWLIVNTSVHPVQGAAHEFGHFLNLPHAGNSCGNTAPESWSPTNDGRLEGVRFNPLRGWRATPAPDGTPSDRKLWDLMTYCANFADRRPRSGLNPAAYPGDAWLSARNWNHVAVALDAFAGRISGSPRVSSIMSSVRARAAQQGHLGFALGVAGPSGGSITRVVGANGQDAVPASVPNSPYRLRSLGPAGQVLLDAGLRVDFPIELKGSDGTFAGPVATNAAAVELLYNGTVLARRNRSLPPKVKLLSPTKKTKVGRGRPLTVRWRGSDKDSGGLQAMVDYSSDGGRIWRTAYMGANRGRVSLPARVLAGSRHARVRVILNDGFSNATSTSATFVAAGNPPKVQIVSPLAGGTVLAGNRTRLSGMATDDLGNRLRGAALTWYAGRTRLGHGESLRVRLSAGRVTLRLVARGHNGLTATASERLSVTAKRLRVITESVPQRVGRKSRTVTLTLRMSAGSRFVAAGKTYTLPARKTKLKIKLPKRPSIGLLKIPFTISSSDRAVHGKIRGAIFVVRV